MVTAAEADRIIAEHKVIEADLVWQVETLENLTRRGRRQRGRRRGTAWNKFTLEASVLSLDSGDNLKLVGNVGKTNRSFTILYENIPIRRYTVHHSAHTDPITNQTFTEPHKHFWDEEWQGRRAYIPNDIRIGDPNEELIDFLNECNISLRGSYAPHPFTNVN